MLSYLSYKIQNVVQHFALVVVWQTKILKIIIVYIFTTIYTREFNFERVHYVMYLETEYSN